jgi:4-diphosphocytidyl-2-C-methyl-D-erythritol kinase
MQVVIPSFAKLNLGLRIGPLRADGFHELRTIYQTIALHDVVRVSLARGSGIEIRCNDLRVPCDSTNTCWRIAKRVMEAFKVRGRVVIGIEKRLPVQGGLGGASGNAVTALLALERALKKELPRPERLRIAAEVGSDLPLFLIGGTVLGVGRGEEAYPLPDLSATPCVVALPEIAVSTPKAFREWDKLCRADVSAGEGTTGKGTASSRAEKCNDEDAALAAGGDPPNTKQVPRLRRSSVGERSFSLGGEKDTAGGKQPGGKLTHAAPSDRMMVFSREISAWLGAAPEKTRHRRSGVSAIGGGRAENPLLDLVRTGIENDFEQVVFPQYPELREVKSVLQRAGARYASLSGSGSAVYGLFDSRDKAAAGVRKLAQRGTKAVLTSTLTRRQYWKKLLAVSS